MNKKIHASVRIDKDMYQPLREEANEKFEGNISLMIRHILRMHLEKQAVLREYINQ